MISYHPMPIADVRSVRMATSHFKVADTADVSRIARGITRHIWSGIAWRDGYRRGDNFLYADWAVMDFDGGFSLAEALNAFCDCIHVIGTTRNHQRAKDGIVADRFRVMVPFEKRVENPRDFLHTMKRLASSYDLDRQCLDLARAYFPCVDLVSTSQEGYCQEVVLAPPETRRAESSIKHVNEIRLDRILRREEVSRGHRNHVFYGVAKDLARLGNREDEIFHAIAQSPTYCGKMTVLLEKELYSTIRSALKSTQKEEVYGRNPDR